jgi:polar amino acid transport system substrate-binding protein
MNASLFAVAILFCFSLSCFAAPSKETLVVGLSLGQGEPYVFDDAVTKGLLYDVASYVSAQAGIPTQFTYKPPARIRQKFGRGEIDVEIGINPAWRSDEADISIYTLPFVDNVNSLVFKKGNYIDVFQGKATNISIGLINAWAYPELKLLFSPGRARRYDYANLDLQLNNLLKGRVDTIVANRLAVQYLAKRDNLAIEFGESVSILPLMIRLHISKKHYLTAINSAVKLGIKQGKFKRIFESYGVSYQAPTLNE